MTTIKKLCLQCGEEFDASLREVKRGNAKFCSRTCSGKHISARKPKPIPNVKCANCGVDFYKSESKKKGSKSGLFFCSRNCKDKAQKIGGLKEIMPDHYGSTNSYRSICWQSHEKKCIICGEDKIVAVHHLDEDHNNHDPKNLVPLCPTHHQYVHSRYKFLVEEQIKNYLKEKWS